MINIYTEHKKNTKISSAVQYNEKNKLAVATPVWKTFTTDVGQIQQGTK